MEDEEDGGRGRRRTREKKDEERRTRKEVRGRRRTMERQRKEEGRESTHVGEMNKHVGETLFSHTHNECYNLHTCTRHTPYTIHRTPAPLTLNSRRFLQLDTAWAWYARAAGVQAEDPQQFPPMSRDVRELQARNEGQGTRDKEQGTGGKGQGTRDKGGKRVSVVSECRG